MYLIHEATVKNVGGVIDITVYVVKPAKRFCKKYEYHLSSQAIAERFHKLYRRGRSLHGKALTILNKNNIKEGSDGRSKKKGQCN
jgi:hypothetical protein